MNHKCDGCEHRGEHYVPMFKPFGVCLKFNNLVEAEKAYKADKCPFAKTFYDSVRVMSLDKMAEFFAVLRLEIALPVFEQIGYTEEQINDLKIQVTAVMKNWLESEVQEDD